MPVLILAGGIGVKTSRPLLAGHMFQNYLPVEKIVPYNEYKISLIKIGVATHFQCSAITDNMVVSNFDLRLVCKKTGPRFKVNDLAGPVFFSFSL